MTCRNSSALSTQFPHLSISSTRPADLSISSRYFDTFAEPLLSSWERLGEGCWPQANIAIDTKRPRLVAERHGQFASSDSVIRSFRSTDRASNPDKTDYVLTNPPFNDSDTALRTCAFLQSEATMQVVSEAKDNMAGFVLANGSMSSNQSGEGDIRRALIEADLVSCMVALPGQLFYSTQIPVCLWFLRRDKSGRPPSPQPSPSGRERSAAEGEGKRGCDRRKQTLFIDARKMGTLIDRVHRELTDADIARIVDTYHAWLGLPSPNSSPAGRGQGEGASRGRRAGDEGDPARVEKYQDIAGFCKSSTTEDIASHSWVLTPGRYVGAEEIADDGDPFEEKMPRLVAELHGQFAESAKLEAAIRKNLKGLGYAL